MVNLKGLSDIGEYSFNEVLEESVKSFIDYGFVEQGAYGTVNIPTSGGYGGNPHVLRPVADPRFTGTRVWEGYRKNWVWESGIPNRSPINHSGVFVNNTFYPTNSGHYVDYLNGRVVFDSAVALNSTVKSEFSFKMISVVSSDILPWFRMGHTRSFRLDESHYTSGSGIWSVLSDTRIQLPAVAVEVVGNKTYTGYQLGGGNIANTRVLLHILSEDKVTNERITSILSQQVRKTFFMYDLTKIQEEDAWPLDRYNSRKDSAKMYPDLIAVTGDGGYRYTRRTQQGKLFINDVVEQSTSKLTDNLYHAVVQWDTEAILHTI